MLLITATLILLYIQKFLEYIDNKNNTTVLAFYKNFHVFFLKNIKLLIFILILSQLNLTLLDVPFLLLLIIFEASLYVQFPPKLRFKIGFLLSLVFCNPLFLIFLLDSQPILLIGSETLGKFFAEEGLKKIKNFKGKNPKFFSGVVHASLGLGLAYGSIKTGTMAHNWVIDNIYLSEVLAEVNHHKAEIASLNEIQQVVPAADLPLNFSQQYITAHESYNAAYERQLSWESKKWV